METYTFNTQRYNVRPHTAVARVVARPTRRLLTRALRGAIAAFGGKLRLRQQPSWARTRSAASRATLLMAVVHRLTTGGVQGWWLPGARIL